jgi:hypothetical protein
MDMNSAPVFLSGNGAARRLDMPVTRLRRAVEAGALPPAGLLDGSPIFLATEIDSIANDLVRRSRICGLGGRS